MFQNCISALCMYMALQVSHEELAKLQVILFAYFE
jgi:hypothetical protein